MKTFYSYDILQEWHFARMASYKNSNFTRTTFYKNDILQEWHFTRTTTQLLMKFLFSLMYKKVADAQYRSKLSNELMMYHMKVSLKILCVFLGQYFWGHFRCIKWWSNLRHSLIVSGGIFIEYYSIQMSWIREGSHHKHPTPRNALFVRPSVRHVFYKPSNAHAHQSESECAR